MTTLFNILRHPSSKIFFLKSLAGIVSIVISILIARLLGKEYFVDYSTRYSKILVLSTLLMMGSNSLVIAKKNPSSKVHVLNMITTWIIILFPLLFALYLLLQDVLYISVIVYIAIKFLPVYYISNKHYIMGILMDSIAINIAVFICIFLLNSVDLGILFGGLTVLIIHMIFLTNIKLKLVNPFEQFKISFRYWVTNSSRLVIDLFLLSIVDVYFNSEELSEIALALKLSLVFSLLLNSINTWIEGTINDFKKQDNIGRYFRILKVTIPLSISVWIVMLIMEPLIFRIWGLSGIDGSIYRILIFANVVLLATGPTNQLLAYNGMLNTYVKVVVSVLILLMGPYFINFYGTMRGTDIILYYSGVIIFENIVKLLCLYLRKIQY